jgi:hypothetical protein
MDGERNTYTIAGKSFYQQPLVLGQARMLLARFKGYPLFDMKIHDLVGMLGEQVSAICAIVLIEEGQTVVEKFKAGANGIADLEAWLDAHAQPQEVAQVVNDFFDSKQLFRAMELMPRISTIAPPSTPAASTTLSSS